MRWACREEMLMKVKLKVRICFLLVVCIFFSTVNTVYAKESSKADDGVYIDVIAAQRVAVKHIYDVSFLDEESPWNNGVRIVQRKALFDVNGDDYAYYFELEDRQGEPQGYVIVSAKREEYPIVEFSDEGGSFLDAAYEAIERDMQWEEDNTLEKSSKIIYLGNSTYILRYADGKGNERLLDISTGDYCEFPSEELVQEVQKEDYSEAWAYYLNAESRGSNPPDSGGDIIEVPSDYESGYKNVRYKDVTGAYRKYFVMSDYMDGKVCAPTAATNLCYYWYNRNSKYTALKIDEQWWGTFTFLFQELDASSTHGTPRKNTPDAIKAYLYNTTNEGKSVVYEIDADRPCILHLSDHYKYGNHATVALGYKQYVYDGYFGDTYSTYIRIADGWTNYPRRFVWGGCKGSWQMTVVWPD